MSAAQEIAVREGHDLKCPRCKVPLEVALREEVEVDHCPKCEGLWVDFFDEKKVLDIQPAVFTVAELRRFRQIYKPWGKLGKVSYEPCPVCTRLMNRKMWGSHSGVIVDRCKDHGTWFDRGEVDKIKEFIQLGGIELEKLKLTETGLSNLESKLNREVLRLDRKINSNYRRARLWSLMGF